MQLLSISNTNNCKTGEKNRSELYIQLLNNTIYSFAEELEYVEFEIAESFWNGAAIYSGTLSKYKIGLFGSQLVNE